jgi:hypothetical protein
MSRDPQGERPPAKPQKFAQRQFPVQPVKAIRPRGNAPAMRYWIHVFAHSTGEEFYTIRRTAPFSAIHECWAGREQGWKPVTAEYIGKRYARYGDAHKTLRRQQEADRASFTAEGKRRHLERLAPRMLALLEEAHDTMAGGAIDPETARTMTRIQQLTDLAKRGY